MPKTARDIMTTDLITVTPTTPIREFARLCVEDNISGAPVLNVDGSLAGLVSKTDLLERLLEDDPRHMQETESLTDMWLGENHPIAEIMIEDMVTTEPDASVPELAALMAQHRIHRLVVLEGGNCVGMITSLDLLSNYGS